MTSHRDYVVRCYGPDALPPRPANPPTNAHGFEPIPAWLRQGPERLPLLVHTILEPTTPRRTLWRRLWQRIRGPVNAACVLIALVAFYGLLVVTP